MFKSITKASICDVQIKLSLVHSQRDMPPKYLPNIMDISSEVTVNNIKDYNTLNLYVITGQLKDADTIKFYQTQALYSGHY